MKDFKGNKLFTPRHVKTANFTLTEDEKELYSAVTTYVKDYFDRAKDNRSITFAMMILQRRLTSSTHAILRSLERRKARLEELLELPDKIKQDTDYERLKHISEEELEDMDEADRWKIEEKLMHLTLWGYKVNTIHGSMKMDARIEAEHMFKNETQIMVATEAAGEGINLQFCSLMVNYDIPWNPNRLEQRMGRIHGYGQDREVFYLQYGDQRYKGGSDPGPAIR